MKYKLAKKRPKNLCKDRRDHSFGLVQDKEVVAEIRKQFPRLVCAIWQCSHCGGVTHGT